MAVVWIVPDPETCLPAQVLPGNQSPLSLCSSSAGRTDKTDSCVESLPTSEQTSHLKSSLGRFTDFG